MKKLFALTALLAIAGTPALAQSAYGEGNASASSSSGSLAASRSNANNAMSLTQTAPANTTAGVNYSGGTSLRTVGVAYAPSINSASIESCNSGISMGGGWMGGAASLGFPIMDQDCNRRLNARTLWQFGMKRAALRALCNSPGMPEALAEEGHQCPVPQQATFDPFGTAEPVKQSKPLPGYAMTADGGAFNEDGTIWLTEGKTGRERLCASYDAAKARCRKWAKR